MRVDFGRKYNCLASSGGCLCCSPEVRQLTERVNAALSRRDFFAGIAAAAATQSLPGYAAAQTSSAPAEPPPPILFTNVCIFDGKSAKLAGAMNVLVEGNEIKTVAAAPIGLPAGAPPVTIDGNGRVLMPGLIDAHTHISVSTIPHQTLLTADPSFIALQSGVAARDMLMRGFTPPATSAALSSGSSARSIRMSCLARAFGRRALPSPRPPAMVITAPCTTCLGPTRPRRTFPKK